jgi:crossover junction endodeoxyribonuclease RuvC
MRILGVDPGLIRTGYGVIEAVSPENISLIEAGVINTSSSDNISVRVKQIYDNLSNIIKEFTPAVLVLEKLYSHYKHPVTAMLMGHARGVICLACGEYNIELVNYAATRIKKAITGNGRAGKHQIRDMVKSMLNLETSPRFFDITDALAIAISYVYIERAGAGD